MDGPGLPAAVAQASRNATGSPDARSIDFVVYSTNSAHGRPYRFPLDEAEDMGRLFFKPAELASYFRRASCGIWSAMRARTSRTRTGSIRHTNRNSMDCSNCRPASCRSSLPRAQALAFHS